MALVRYLVLAQVRMTHLPHLVGTSPPPDVSVSALSLGVQVQHSMSATLREARVIFGLRLVMIGVANRRFNADLHTTNTRAAAVFILPHLQRRRRAVFGSCSDWRQYVR